MTIQPKGGMKPGRTRRKIEPMRPTARAISIRDRKNMTTAVIQPEGEARNWIANGASAQPASPSPPAARIKMPMKRLRRSAARCAASRRWKRAVNPAAGATIFAERSWRVVSASAAQWRQPCKWV
ncbi:MAG: hypothetical protein KJZ57_10490 [Anaerolineales bacterium]|nr:hypothetical protein [Anaerolineales bacterium]